MRIGFIGTGTIATAMVRGIASDNHQIIVTKRSRVNSAQLANDYPNVTVTADPQTVIDNSDTIFVCLLTDTAKALLPTLTFQPHQQVYSVIVGIDLAALTQITSPAAECGILIPFPFIAQGNSPILAYPQSERLETIFGGRNHIITLSSEEELNSYLAAQAVLSPTINLVHQTAAWLSQRTNDPNSAEMFLRTLIGGSLTAAAITDSNVLATSLQELNTEGGLNAQLRNHFIDSGVEDILHAGLNKLESRLQNN